MKKLFVDLTLLLKMVLHVLAKMIPSQIAELVVFYTIPLTH
jgi:hypothetical protein